MVEFELGLARTSTETEIPGLQWRWPFQHFPDDRIAHSWNASEDNQGLICFGPRGGWSSGQLGIFCTGLRLRCLERDTIKRGGGWSKGLLHLRIPEKPPLDSTPAPWESATSWVPGVDYWRSMLSCIRQYKTMWIG